MSEDAPIRIGFGEDPYAVISDIHSNLAALEAVFEDIDSQGVNRVFCLGDIIGYGPQPEECRDLTLSRSLLTICGNHEAALNPSAADRFHPRARDAIQWTRRRLEETCGRSEVEKLLDLPRRYSDGNVLLVHGSPLEPTTEYLLPRDSLNNRRMEMEFARAPRLAFNGHSHLPGVIEHGSLFRHPTELFSERYIICEKQAIINIGSVGQPRDGIPDSCYVIVKDNVVQYRRVRYDINRTRDLILEIPDLDPFLGDRLLEGK